MAKLARQIEAIPIVSGATERDALFPNPERDQRVEIRGTGEQQQWDGLEWRTLPGNFYAAQRARGVRHVDDPEYGGALSAAASAGNVVALPATPITQDAATTLTDVDVQGQGQVSNITTATVAGQYAMRFVRGTSGRFRSARDFMLTVATACANAIRVEYPRFLLQNVRVTASAGVAISDAMILLENAFIAQLNNVFAVAADVGQIPLRLGTAANAVDIIGGEYAGPGKCIVIDGGRRINVQTCIEGTATNRADGLEINGGDTIYVNSYFENKGVRINGGNRGTIGGSFANSEAVIAINGGTNWEIAHAKWPATTHPRAAVIVASGLDYQVRFRQSVELGSTKFVLADSIVTGEHVGTNLLVDPFVSAWLDANTPTHYTITKTGSSAVISRTTARLTGEYALRWDSNTTPASSTRGIQISLTHLLSVCKGHRVTVGVWMKTPSIVGSGATYRVHLVTTPAATSAQALPVAAFEAVADKYVFFSHTTYVDPAATALWIQVNVLGNQLGTEWFEIDRMAVVIGETSQNVPFHIAPPSPSLFGTATWNPSALADGAGETSAAIAVPGAAFGDFVQVAAPYDLQGITCNGYVSAANEVKIRLQNKTGGTIDLASGTWRVRVVKS